MSLSEIEKIRIQEEEEYRAGVRGEFNDKYQPRKKGLGCLKAIGIVLGSVMLVFVISTVFISEQDNGLNQTQEGQVQTGDGNITIGYSTIDGRKTYIATFKNNFPPDGKIIGENLGKVIGYTFGDIGIPKIKTFEKDGVNYLSISAKDGKLYTVLLLKDKNDMVFGMNYWQD